MQLIKYLVNKSTANLTAEVNSEIKKIVNAYGERLVAITDVVYTETKTFSDSSFGDTTFVAKIIYQIQKV